MKSSVLGLAAVAGGLVGACAFAGLEEPVDGVYPHLAMSNDEDECGTGAVVPWAGSLWVVTYGPHCPCGSSDKLYQITPDLKRVVRSESVGGTPANRLIHRETNQLLIGPYVIDAKGKVRAVPPAKMPGRLTGAARHLVDPANLVYVATMDNGLYALDMNTLAVKTLLFNGVSCVRKPKPSCSRSSPCGLRATDEGLFEATGRRERGQGPRFRTRVTHTRKKWCVVDEG